jgi:hypothetical protein
MVNGHLFNYFDVKMQRTVLGNFSSAYWAIICSGHLVITKEAQIFGLRCYAKGFFYKKMG